MVDPDTGGDYWDVDGMNRRMNRAVAGTVNIPVEQMDRLIRVQVEAVEVARKAVEHARTGWGKTLPLEAHRGLCEAVRNPLPEVRK